MHNDRTRLWFYHIMLWLLAGSLCVHVTVDDPSSTTDYIINLFTAFAAVVLIAATMFVFRPLMKRMSANVDSLNNAMSSIQLFETVVASANDAVVITNADLSATGPEIVFVNEAFTRISGYTREEVIGKSPRFLQNEFTKRETLDEMKAKLLAGLPFKGELLNSTKEGKHYWLEISIVPVRDSHGTITNFAAIERDVTARKEEERAHTNMWLQLNQATRKTEAMTKQLKESLAKAEEANKAKSDFLANMSHELRTPMNGVLGMAQLLSDTRLDGEQKELVSTINYSGENLLMLLNDILDFSKIEAGALELENTPFNLKDTILPTVALLTPNAHKKGIELLADCEADIPPYIMGDSGRLRQVITNLIGNAIKFTETGYVNVSAKTMEHADGLKLHIRVQDTGIGIPEDKINSIFEKFTQADASVTRKYGGTGLGLTISKHLVALMGGEMGVESVVGKGSTFWFTIPCTVADYCEVEHETHAHIQREDIKRIPIASAKALLVEDYHVNRVFAEKLLRKFGFTHIDTAENGVEAIMKYRSQMYDIIFMDCQMPELDGYQTTEKLRLIESDTPMHTPIIAMTANAMMGDREKCLKAGMDDYISKPLRAQHLRSILLGLFTMEEKAEANAIITRAEILKTQPATPAVDVEQLRMFTDGDPEEEKALAQLFIEQAGEMIAILEKSIDTAQKDTWKSAAHRFKGSSGNLGAMQLHHLCKRAESHFEDAGAKKQEMLSAIKAETRNVESFFQQALAS